MDIVQFGRWLAERRRACGWRSQRALVSASLADTHTRDAGITAAFLARLEAGLLAHPFRGSVRKRVLALTWLLCKSPRQVRAFVQHAGITDLSRTESAELDEVCSWLASPPLAPAVPVVIVPPRPVPFVGRESATREIVHALVEESGRCVVITGMPGIGKSALAANVAHVLARSETGAGGRFADGLIAVTCEGRRGMQGLVAVLEDVLLLSAPGRTGRRSSGRQDGLPLTEADARNQGQEGESRAPEAPLLSTLPAALSGVTARVRAALAGKRMLVVLDNVDGRFPLDQAVNVLGTAELSPNGDQREVPGVAVLATTRYVPRLPLAASRIHLGPLAGDDAVALFEALLGRAPTPEERTQVREACEAVGHVPLAIAALATTASLQAVPLSIIASQARAQPLELELDGGRTLRMLYAEALAALAPEAQEHYALLSVAAAPTLSFDSVMALRKALDFEANAMQATAAGSRDDGWLVSPEETPEPRDRVETARAVEQLVRHSLLDVEQRDRGRIRAANPSGVLADAGRVRFRLPPLLRTYASERAALLDGRTLRSARQELSRHALEYAEGAEQNVEILSAESELLHAAVAHAWQDGDHTLTATLVHQTLPLFYQLDTCSEIERILRWGLQASQAQRTDRRTGIFLNHLGIILYYRGDIGGARRAWEQAEALSRSLVRCPLVGGALHNLSQLAELEGDDEGAWQLADQAVRHGQRLGASWMLGSSLLLRGQLARRAGDRDQAHKDVSSSLEVFAALPGIPGMKTEDNVMRTSAHAELARIERNYPRARQLAGQMLDAANRSARLAGIELALEQAEYALDEGMLRDAQRLAQQASVSAREVGAYLLDRRATLLMRRATESRDQLRRPS